MREKKLNLVMLIGFFILFIWGIYEVLTNPTQKNLILLVCFSLVLLEKILLQWFAHLLNNKKLMVLRWLSTLAVCVLLFNPMFL